MGNSTFKDEWFAKGKLDQLAQWLEENDVNTQNKYGNTVVHWSCWHSQPQMLKMCLEAGALVNVVNRGMNSPLHVAVYQNDLKCVELLLATGECDDQAVNLQGLTALDVAEGKGHIACVNMLTNYAEQKEQVGSAIEDSGNTTTGGTARGAVEGSGEGNGVESKDDAPASNIFAAIRKLFPAPVPDAVLQKEVDILNGELVYDTSQLLELDADDLKSMGIKLSTVRALLKVKQGIIDQAKQQAESKSIKVPTKKKSKKNAKKKVKPWKHKWFTQGKVKKLEAWVRKYPDNVGYQNQFGNTIAHWAAWHGQLPMLIVARKAGVELDVKNNGNNTPLHLAVHRNSTSCVQYLISEGANLRVSNLQGFTPLKLAKAVRHTHIEVLLKRALGIDLNAEEEEEAEGRMNRQESLIDLQQQAAVDLRMDEQSEVSVTELEDREASEVPNLTPDDEQDVLDAIEDSKRQHQHDLPDNYPHHLADEADDKAADE